MVSLSVHVDCWYTVLFFGSLFESTWRILEMSVLRMTTDPPYLLVTVLLSHGRPSVLMTTVAVACLLSSTTPSHCRTYLAPRSRHLGSELLSITFERTLTMS